MAVKAPRAWYRFQALADDASVADLYIYDVIGESFWNEQAVSATKLLDELKALPDTVKALHVHINSPGGDVFDAVAIANMLRAQSAEKKRSVEVSIEGLAASAATIVSSAGDVIRVADNALVMIHNPWAIAWGTAADMRQTAESLDRVRDAIIATYRWKSQLGAEDLGALMDATTWMNAEEALANGFATEIVSGLKAAAVFRPEALNRLGQIPDKYRARVATFVAAPTAATAPAAPPAPPVAMDATEILRLCREAGCLDLAEGLIAAKASAEGVRAKLVTVREIRAVCKAAKQDDRAAHYIAAGVSVDFVRAELTHWTAKIDRVEIDAHLDPTQHAGGERPQLSATNIYRERNGLAATGGKA